MNEKDQNQPESQIIVNEYGATQDPAVFVDESTRGVLLTETETIVFEKQPQIQINPITRPRKVYCGMWGQAEIVTIGLVFFAVLSILLVYIFLVIPSSRELEQNRAERDRLESELVASRDKYGSITSVETQVARLVSSVDDFESHYLPVATNGRTSLYQRLNGLIGAYGLVNTTGPDYTPLELADNFNANQSDEERGRAKFRSLFPGMYVTMTVEGPYANLRRFIREIETANEFVIISAVELEPTDNTRKQKEENNAPILDDVELDPVLETGPRPPRLQGKTHGETVSLRMEMAAYFRRPVKTIEN